MDRKEILKVIIDRGGLMGAAARMYINDDQKSDGFIRECYAQCHNKSAQELWGKELVSEIMKYAEFNQELNHHCFEGHL